jgi:hypothetical protein
MPKLGNGYQTASNMQKVLYENIMNPRTDKKLLAPMATAWEKLAERKRILSMTPKPKDIDIAHILKPRAMRVLPSFTEPEPQTPVSTSKPV